MKIILIIAGTLFLTLIATTIIKHYFKHRTDVIKDQNQYDYMKYKRLSK